MRDLAQMRCVPCRGGVPPLSEIEIRELCPLISEWELVEEGGVPRLSRRFSFKILRLRWPSAAKWGISPKLKTTILPS